MAEPAARNAVIRRAVAASLFSRALGPVAVAVAVLVSTTAIAAVPAALQSAQAAPAPGKPEIKLSKDEAGVGTSITVSGKGWRSKALLMLIICGQNRIGGSDTCANGDGRAVTTKADGTFSRKLPVAEPPKPCPCVVYAATVKGEKADTQTAFKVAGHDTAGLPSKQETARLVVRGSPQLNGEGGVLNFFGAPQQRTLVLTLANEGAEPVRNPVFEVGVGRGVLAPEWEHRKWRGTIPARGKAEIKVPVELSSGAYGDHLVALQYEGRLLVEEPWQVGRPWGVTVFWLLLIVVVPAGVFRIGMAAVGRVRPAVAEIRKPPTGRHRAGRFSRLPSP